MQAKTLEKLRDDLISNQSIVTKKDLEVELAKIQLEIANVHKNLILWMLGTGVGGVIAMASIIKYFH